MAAVIDQKLLDAIKEVESKGDVDAIGDKGLSNKAYGAYQIRKPYYVDAVEFNSSLKTGKTFPDDVKGAGSEGHSEDIIRSYMKRYATAKRLGRTPTNEDIARIHNGGPKGYENPDTEKYWKKVKEAMDKQ